MEPREAQEAELVVLVDNVVDQARPGSGNVVRQPLFTPEGLVPLLAEHGLSLVVRLLVDGRWRSVMLDAGVSGTAAVANAAALGVELADVEAVVVSHGHADHTAGFGVMAGRLAADTPVIVHPDAFDDRLFVLPDGTRLPQPRLGPETFGGLEVVTSEGPTELLDGALVVTGAVPRRTAFEKGMGVQYAVKDGELVADDQVRDDQAIAFVLEGRGAVVVSGCAHAGIVNTTRYALSLLGTEALHAAAGGFHLCWPTPPEVVDRTVEAMAAMAPRTLMPLHCTGREATDLLARAFGEAFVMGGSGTRLRL
jgi:7,8-dihydropterin-6-yl-methyl-4-(beta-D-ribofuranosyl)aminobenzene 5'-phosphate synthase